MQPNKPDPNKPTELYWEYRKETGEPISASILYLADVLFYALTVYPEEQAEAKLAAEARKAAEAKMKTEDEEFLKKMDEDRM